MGSRRARGAGDRRRAEKAPLSARRRSVGSAIVAAGGIAGRVLALARDAVIAALFRRDETDAFFVAFTIPNVLRQILGEGAASNAVAPELSRTIARSGDDAARALFQRVRGAAVVVLGIVTLAGILLARPLTDLLAGGYHDRHLMFERTVLLSRNLFPYLLLMGVGAIGTMALQLKRRYGAAAFAPVVLNGAFIVAAFALASPLDARGFDRAQALTVGALGGGVLQIALLYPALRRAGWTGAALVDFRHPSIRAIGRRLGPIAIGVVVYAIDLVIARRLLSHFETGAQSWFTWALRLCDFPQQLCGLAVATIAATSLARVARKSNEDTLAKTASSTVRLTIFFTLPASVALVVLAEPLVALVFERGEFDAVSTIESSRALVWQGAALWCAATGRQLVTLSYALRDARTPLIAGALDVAVFVAIALGLRGHIGHVAVSAAIAGASAAQAIALFVWAKRRLRALRIREILVSTARTTGASVLAAIAAWTVALLLAAAPGAGGVRRALPALAALAAFTATYLAASWSLRSPELAVTLGALRRKSH